MAEMLFPANAYSVSSSPVYMLEIVPLMGTCHPELWPSPAIMT